MSKALLVTGASRGIGLEVVKSFLTSENDYTSIVMIARESEDFSQVLIDLARIAPEGKKIFSYAGDVGDSLELQKLVQRIYCEVGNIDLLVNNAGYTNPVPLQQVELSDFERTMAVNLYAPFILVQSLLQLGNKFEIIVNIASTAGIQGRAGWLTYSASKAALINMSSVMREELAIYGTRVVCLSPGRTATALRRVLAPDEDPSTIMQPSHVADIIKVFTSGSGRFIDSENIVVRQ